MSGSKVSFITGQRVDFRFEDISVAKGYVLPTVEFSFIRSSRTKSGEQQEANLVTNIGMKVFIWDATQSDLTIIGYAKCQTIQQTWRIEDEGSHLTFDLTLDHYTLSQIEKIRKSSDLNLNFNIRFQAFVVGKEFKAEFSQLQDYSICSSTWVEKILSEIDYRNVALIEVPVLEYRKLTKAIDILNSAWKSYSTGDIDDVLVKCRKAMHEIGKQVKNAGFVTQVEESDKSGKKHMQKYPDWKHFFDSDSKADIVKTIIQKMSGFVAPGAHEIDVLPMNHAYFALLQTFSLTYLVISRFKMLDDKN
jgi:hypothetical protein